MSTAIGMLRTVRSRGLRRLVAVAVVAALAVVTFIVLTGTGTKSAVAILPSAKSLYVGSDVRIMGVTVGVIDAIRPDEQGVRVEFHYDADYRVPADVKAVVIAPALVTSRFIQLAPGYLGGPELADQAVIPKSRTAVPVEFDEIKTELNKLSVALGPKGANKNGSVGRLLNTAANYRGQGKAFHAAIAEVSSAMQTLSAGRKDLFGTVRNLQVFVSALAASDDQIAQFTQRLDSVSGLLDDNKDELARALVDLNKVAVDVQQFLRDNRGAVKGSTTKLAELARTLSSVRPELERALHVAPTTLENFYHVYDPLGGSFTGAVAASNFANPAQMFCSAIQGASHSTPSEAAKLCRERLGPLLGLLQMNYPPIEANPLVRDGAPTAGSQGGR